LCRYIKTQLGLTTILLTAAVYVLAICFLPDKFILERASRAAFLTFTPVKAWGCVCSGLWSGCLIGEGCYKLNPVDHP
jgi:hypothetical protein